MGAAGDSWALRDSGPFSWGQGQAQAAWLGPPALRGVCSSTSAPAETSRVRHAPASRGTVCRRTSGTDGPSCFRSRVSVALPTGAPGPVRSPWHSLCRVPCPIPAGRGGPSPTRQTPFLTPEPRIIKGPSCWSWVAEGRVTPPMKSHPHAHPGSSEERSTPTHAELGGREVRAAGSPTPRSGSEAAGGCFLG